MSYSVAFCLCRQFAVGDQVIHDLYQGRFVGYHPESTIRPLRRFPISFVVTDERDPAEIEVSAQVRQPQNKHELTDTAGRLLAAGAQHIVVTAFSPVQPDVIVWLTEALSPLR